MQRGNGPLGPKPVEDQLPLVAQGAGDLFHRFDRSFPNQRKVIVKECLPSHQRIRSVAGFAARPLSRYRSHAASNPLCGTPIIVRENHGTPAVIACRLAVLNSTTHGQLASKNRVGKQKPTSRLPRPSRMPNSDA